MGSIRIIAGHWRKSVIPVLEKPGLRPTPDRVRETLFNWLNSRLPVDWSEALVADVFAGTGALGLEAVSRGARITHLVERDRDAADRIQSALDRLQPPQGSTVRVLCQDGLQWLRRQGPGSLDLVFLDPPYASGLLEPAVLAAARSLREGGLITVERPSPLDAEWLKGLEEAESGVQLDVLASARAGAVHYGVLRPASL